MLNKILPSAESAGNPIRDAWDKLSDKPGGKAMFNMILSRMVPYTGSMGAKVVELGMGHAKVTLQDRRAVRNHLRSVHAIALANLIELAGNIGVVYSLPDDARFIVKGIHVEYHKKARGLLTATSNPAIIADNHKQEVEVRVEIHNERGELVCSGTLDTLVGPKKKA